MYADTLKIKIQMTAVLSIKLFQEVRDALDAIPDRALQVMTQIENLINNRVSEGDLLEYGYNTAPPLDAYYFDGRYRAVYAKPLHRSPYSLRVDADTLEELKGIDQWQDKLRRMLLGVFCPGFKIVIPTLPEPKLEPVKPEPLFSGRRWGYVEEEEEDETLVKDHPSTKEFFEEFPTFSGAVEDDHIKSFLYRYLKEHGHKKISELKIQGIDGSLNDLPDYFLAVNRFVMIGPFEGKLNFPVEPEVTPTREAMLYQYPLVMVDGRETIPDAAIVEGFEVWQVFRWHLKEMGVDVSKVNLSKLRKIEGFN